MLDGAGKFSQRLGYRFRDPSLLGCGLTHASARGEQGVSNERLEYVGDAALGLAVCEALYQRLPESSEGDLTSLKSRYVCNTHLASVARSLDLGSFLRMGRSEDRVRGRERERCLADALEAVIGAVYLDGGMEPVRRIVRRFVMAGEAAPRSAKAVLQEWLQSRGRNTPDYVVVQEVGPSHNRSYRIEARCESHTGHGEGHSKKAAQNAAAADVLAQLVRTGRMDTPGIARESALAGEGAVTAP